MTDAANATIDVTFRIARGSDLHRTVRLFITDLNGCKLGEFAPDGEATVRLLKSNPVFCFGTPHDTPRFRFDSSKTEAVMFWDGRRWTCENAIQLQGSSNAFNHWENAKGSSVTSSKISESSPFTYIGLAGLVSGILWIVFAFKMNVYVCGGFWAGTELCVDSDKVLNLSLAQTRNMHFGGAALLTLCSLLTFFFGLSRKKSLPE